MPNPNRPSAAIVAMAATLLLLPSTGHAAQHAAKVVYAFGQVQAVGGSGKTRPLSRGDAIVPGDTVVTRRGRAQLRFTDGGFAAMQPNTEYRVDDYAFKGEADGSERSFLSLVRGSVRLVTGIIGRANKQNYRIRTSVATIGIRGTSGRLSHCDSNCGARGPGTKLQGYGGTWDLSSGSFSGPVDAKQAKFCNGVSCFDLPGFGQHEDVPPEEELDDSFGEEEEDVAGSAYQQGNQSGSDGTQCDLGGACGDIVVATGLVGADAFQEAPLTGDTGMLDNLAIVTRNGIPVGGITVAGPNAEPGDGDIEILTRDIGAFRSAFAAVGDPQIAALGNAILNAVPQTQIALLNAMPAVIGEGDFGRTNDDLLVKGRFTRGFLLEVSVFLNGTPEVFSKLIKLTNFQSDHFIFGPDPLFVPFAGQANYKFTGGTFSTAVDGSSIGPGATAGTLSFDFGLLGGQIAMTVKHGPTTFNVLGGLKLDNDPKFFRDNMVVANAMGGSYPVTLDGFFAVPNGVKAPRAAGLSYVIDMPVDLIGTAGFGLAGTSTPALPPVVPQLANGSYLAFAHHFLQGGVTQTTNADDFIIGPLDTAFTAAGGALITQFNSTTPVDLCAGVACVFNAATANAVLDANGPGMTTTNAALGVRWNRWDPNHMINHNQAPTPGGPMHVLVADAPTAMGAVPGVGSGMQGQYNMLVGGSTPTVVYENNGVLKGNVAPFVDVQWTTATMNIIFDTAMVTANFAGNFPAVAPVGSFTLAGGGAFNSLAATHSLNLAGTVTSAAVSAAGGAPNCGGPCVITGHTHFDVLGVGATAIGGSIEASTSGPSPKFGVAGTYLLQGSVAAFP